MTELLRGHLAHANLHRAQAEQEGLRKVEYRNLAPLYAEEEMKVCGKRGAKEGEWELWIEGIDGRLAVRALATTDKGLV